MRARDDAGAHRAGVAVEAHRAFAARAGEWVLWPAGYCFPACGWTHHDVPIRQTVEETHGQTDAELRESLGYARFGGGVNEFYGQRLGFGEMIGHASVDEGRGSGGGVGLGVWSESAG